MKHVPPIQKYMTKTPHSIGAEQSLATARDFMKSKGIRHLPVLESGRLVGILSDRDLKMAMGFEGINPLITRVSDFALEDPYTVSPNAPLDQVASVLAERKIGSALIVDQGRLLGIFTATDAMAALAEITRA